MASPFLGNEALTSHDFEEEHHEKCHHNELVHNSLLTLGTIELRGRSGNSGGTGRALAVGATRIVGWRSCHNNLSGVGVMAASWNGHYSCTSAEISRGSNEGGELRSAWANVRACGLGDSPGGELFSHAGTSSLSSGNQASAASTPMALGHGDKSLGENRALWAFSVGHGGNNGGRTTRLIAGKGGDN
ncbi:hypothetical protein N7509_008887 [Penicillium cosmopolitanum]|uniref:Uncharacterized protein n=1 Tax=Penicillium cosmopolitanum TaxID=1131564 RepID=A0A9X0B353_9EURO|nr:uncharacterized protein N7509_008887 [Penicillium cosmopolitanum]KAJ5386346.1 hypothetical protein N7509_008887 [Penicillium cosmopolitanum]